MNSFNICIIRPQGYLWSSVFMELAELIAYSLEDVGHSVRVTENYLHPTGKNLIIGCHLIDISLTHQIPSGSIIFNTEQVGAGPEIWNQRVLHFVRNFESWDYSERNIEQFKSLGIRCPKRFKFGYHPKLNRISKDIAKDIDVLFYGAMNERRTAVLDTLEQSGLRVKRLFGVFGPERDSFIARAKVVLNMHQHDTKDFEIVRAHYLMNNQKAILTQFDFETNIDPDYKDGLILANYQQLVSVCVSTLQSDETLKEYERKSLDAIKKFDSVEIIKELMS